MAKDKQIHVLSDLMKLDVDAVHAYEQAIDRIDVRAIRDALEEFKGDHDRHVDELSRAIRDLGGEPPERTPDIKGFLIEGFTAIRSATGTEGAMKAMRSNEKMTNKKYDKALDEELAPDVRSLVERNRDDERRHLAYIERVLEVGLERAATVEPEHRPGA